MCRETPNGLWLRLTRRLFRFRVHMAKWLLLLLLLLRKLLLLLLLPPSLQPAIGPPTVQHSIRGERTFQPMRLWTPRCSI